MSWHSYFTTCRRWGKRPLKDPSLSFTFTFNPSPKTCSLSPQNKEDYNADKEHFWYNRLRQEYARREIECRGKTMTENQYTWINSKSKSNQLFSWHSLPWWSRLQRIFWLCPAAATIPSIDASQWIELRTFHFFINFVWPYVKGVMYFSISYS